MDEDMGFVEDLVVDEPLFLDVDSVYEFDACQFFDFSRGETESEAQEAETWFQYAHEYPPSPFIVKLKMMKAAKALKARKTSYRKTETNKKTSTSSNSDGETGHESPSREFKYKGLKHQSHIPQDFMKLKSKSTFNLPKPSGSSFMKPTASHLAKQNKECETHSIGRGRLQKPLVSSGETLKSPARNQATKRQKLEIGYLRKVAQLKHRASYMHKMAKKVDQSESSSNSRCKITTPKKPAMVTEERAQKQKPQNKSESIQQPKANTPARGRTLNKKILEGTPKLPQLKKSTSHLTGVQEFHLKTTPRAMQVQPANVLYKQNSAPAMSEAIILIKSQNSGNAGKKDKFRSPNNLKAEKAHQIKDSGFTLTAKQNSNLPPIELFKKLSLKTESETKAISSLRQPRLTKATKENVPRTFQEFRRCGGKQNQCGADRRIAEIKT